MIISQFYPLLGGAEVQAQLLACGLIRRGMKVSVLTRKLKGLPKHEMIAGMTIDLFDAFHLHESVARLYEAILDGKVEPFSGLEGRVDRRRVAGVHGRIPFFLDVRRAESARHGVRRRRCIGEYVQGDRGVRMDAETECDCQYTDPGEPRRRSSTVADAAEALFDVHVHGHSRG